MKTIYEGINKSLFCLLGLHHMLHFYSNISKADITYCIDCGYEIEETVES